MANEFDFLLTKRVILYSRMANVPQFSAMATISGSEVLVLLKLAAHPHRLGPRAANQKNTAPNGDEGKPEWTYVSLGMDLRASPSVVHKSIQFCIAARLYDEVQRAPIRRNLLEFLVHGVKYAFPPKRGQMTRGFATSFAGSPLVSRFQQGQVPPPVWPHPVGGIAGLEFEPIWPSAPDASRLDQALYELLVLVDAIRDGEARVSEVAIDELTQRLKPGI